ncbi:MAG: hypothetical protein ACTHMY_03755 [Solirubrobacteraceae bacterium]
MRVGRQQGLVVVVVVGGGFVAAACGSSKTVTVTNTVVKESTTTVTASTPTATTGAATTSTPAAPGSAPALSGTYALNRTSEEFNVQLPNDNPHDGFYNADQSWTFSGGSCSAGKCQVSLRRLMSDSTIEDLTLFSNSPTGVYTGTIPGGEAADCGSTQPHVKLTMNVRVGGLQNSGGQTVASRLLGHIFADFVCPGATPSHDTATYTGTHS